MTKVPGPKKPEEHKPKGKQTIMTMSLTAADAERLKKAFADGLLAEFGVLDIQLVPEPNATKGKWASKSIGRKKTDEDVGKPESSR